MYILKNLWRGQIIPSERYVCPNSEYQRLSNKLCKEIELFTKELSLEGKKHYANFEKLQLELMSISEEDAFVVGFRTGARTIMDIIGEHERQFKSPEDV